MRTRPLLPGHKRRKLYILYYCIVVKTRVLVLEGREFITASALKKDWMPLSLGFRIGRKRRDTSEFLLFHDDYVNLGMVVAELVGLQMRLGPLGQDSIIR